MAMTSLQRRVTLIVFVSLVFDLLAFSMPLPLFPRLIESYVDSSDQSRLLATLLGGLQKLRARLASRSGLTGLKSIVDPSPKWDIVLLGGALGSVFSLMQFVISPVIGRLSDSKGRKTVLLWTMVGNVVSTALWLVATTFDTFLLSRIVGGLSEGNVQLSIAIMTDVSDATSRASALAFVGIAFSLCFTLGPPFGAWLATRPFNTASTSIPLNIYAVPAAICLALLLAEVAVLVTFLPETRHLSSNSKKDASAKSADGSAPTASVAERKRTLKALRRLHLSFLFLFSGAEYSLTFYLYDLLNYSSLDNGKLLGFIGLLSCLLQGGYVRRASKKTGPARFVRSGILTCAVGVTLLSSLTALVGRYGQKSRTVMVVLYLAAACLAYTSATVVTCLTALASLQCDDEATAKSGRQDKLLRGEQLGRFRSQGQLGRALGPIACVGAYWLAGPTICYLSIGTAIGYLWISSSASLRV